MDHDASQPRELNLVLCDGDVCLREQVRVQPRGQGFEVMPTDAEPAVIPAHLDPPAGVPDLAGSSTPFSTETLQALYPNVDTYLARFETAVRQGLERGILLPRDAERLCSEAANTRIP